MKCNGVGAPAPGWWVSGSGCRRTNRGSVQHWQSGTGVCSCVQPRSRLLAFVRLRQQAGSASTVIVFLVWHDKGIWCGFENEHCSGTIEQGAASPLAAFSKGSN